MNHFKFRLFSLFLVSLVGGSAHAGHIGLGIGPTVFGNGGSGSSGGSSTHTTISAEAMFGMLPTFELGGFYQTTSVGSGSQALMGAALNFYPIVLRIFYVGGRFANANQNSSNRFAYAPVAGFNFDLLPTVTAGVEAQYFRFMGSASTNPTSMISGIATIRVWF